MLQELRIRGYAIIDDVRLELEPGLNVLTGETGAGKSIIVGALSLLLGERASNDVVRSGEDRAIVEGVFSIPQLGAVAATCREAGIDVDDGWLIVRREVHQEGRNRAWLNGSAATTSLIARVCEPLVDLHGQHQHQALLHAPAQRDILDAFAGAEDAAAEVGEAFAEVQSLRSQIVTVSRRAAETRERLEFLRFKAEEIESADLQAGEDERAASESRRLEHSEELLGLSGGLYDRLYESEDAVVEVLGGLRRSLAELQRIDPETEELGSLFESASRELEELGRLLGVYRGTVEHDPARLRCLRERLDLLYRLKRKYGDTLDDVVQAGAGARAEVAGFEAADYEIESLREAERAAVSRLASAADRLSAHRSESATRLGAAVSALLPDLGMPAGRFEVALVPLEAPGRHGSESVEYRVTLNPGFELSPLRAVASGGELSRLMLALKTVLATVDDTPCLVFDEIDAGIGGQVGRQVASRLADVGRNHQVFVVTHLPQIASAASVHIRVSKGEVGGIASADTVRLDEAGRIEEIARMLGGDPDSGASRLHAQELRAAGRGDVRTA